MGEQTYTWTVTRTVEIDVEKAAREAIEYSDYTSDGETMEDAVRDTIYDIVVDQTGLSYDDLTSDDDDVDAVHRICKDVLAKVEELCKDMLAKVKEADGQGCDFCRGGMPTLYQNLEEGRSGNDFGSTFTASKITPRHCPMCGRKLEE